VCSKKPTESMVGNTVDNTIVNLTRNLINVQIQKYIINNQSNSTQYMRQRLTFKFTLTHTAYITLLTLSVQIMSVQRTSY
jgi:hypothetical protein